MTSFTKIEYEQSGDPLVVLKAVTVNGIPQAENGNDVVIHVTATPIHPGHLLRITGIHYGE